MEHAGEYIFSRNIAIYVEYYWKIPVLLLLKCEYYIVETSKCVVATGRHYLKEQVSASNKWWFFKF